MNRREVSVYLSIGSNMGNKLAYIIEGLIKIDSLNMVEIDKVSPFYETPPWGYVEQDSFYNIAVKIRTSLLPYELLKELQRIELELHRTRELRWGPRTLDIDIIIYDNLNLNNEKLILPHPRYRERKFVLKPLYDIYDYRENLLKYIVGLGDKIDRIIPRVGVSSCLLGEKCSYRGDHNKRKLLSKLELDYIEVCPEVLGGMTTPRPPAERRGSRVVNIEGIDVTKEFSLGAMKTLEELEGVELAILKAKSPSCGKGEIYDGTFTSKLIDGNGVTTQMLIDAGIDVVNM